MSLLLTNKGLHTAILQAHLVTFRNFPKKKLPDSSPGNSFYLIFCFLKVKHHKQFSTKIICSP